MKRVKYRFNRKEGLIYQGNNTELTCIGNKLQMIVLWASEPVFGKPFDNLSAQKWVQLTFLDRAGNWCYAVLGNGTTEALAPWLEYRRLIEEKTTLSNVITTIGFEETESKYQWFEFTFSGATGNNGLGDRMQEVMQKSPFSLIEPLGLIS
ncbi:hypothetical protein [Microcoleus sp. bin38.metabat.b11b12b14.051]|uniref:hypothetical protein n=1 Tax=Microcoleus sp. bin38.metabat.b11b12b14.051 TaxID=2742709 RepID=UPI0025FF3923|nr:hypothetical protein [Microcoleus sp. bin38.metabat.b11b12b14.051]